MKRFQHTPNHTTNHEPANDKLSIPMRSISKSEIIQEVQRWANLSKITDQDPVHLFVYLKQMEEAIRLALELFEERAMAKLLPLFQVHGNTLSILGHKIRLQKRTQWQFSTAFEEYMQKERDTLKAAKRDEKATGRAQRANGKSVLAVVLRR